MARVLIGPQILAFLPALTLAAYWYGGEALLLIVAILIPGVFAVAGMYSGTGPAWATARDGDTGLVLRSGVEKALCTGLEQRTKTGETTAALVIQLEDFDDISQQYGRAAVKRLLKQSAERICGCLRDSDVVARIGESRFGIAFGPLRRADLEIMIRLSGRLQTALAEPFSVDAARVYLTASVGFCLPTRIRSNSGEEMLKFAELAVQDATANGAGSIRAFTNYTKSKITDSGASHKEISDAMNAGHIRAWFQPQISTDTGAITGFEALARWEHPDRGTLLPRNFLTTVYENDLNGQLGEIMLTQALAAMKAWRKAGHDVGVVSVNFSSQDLQDPKACEKVKWQLDRFEVAAENLCIEILENVVAVSDDDVIVKNIVEFSQMGCRIDLDDFGTGHSSIANIRRFSVDRIKIDRSFVTRIDRDREQQKVVTAVLVMAEQLELETLAEGVETLGEHAMLAQLGCNSVQGFSVARPMPVEDTIHWIDQHHQKLSKAPQIARSIGQ
ncbi:MAG: phosphodiesterase [Marinosulfonomonas sp.]|nr:phosphodiesterase [Marinosulfonomonas sp.]